MRVLLVEDDSALASVVVEALEQDGQDGHSATHVRETDEALRLSVAERWDAFVVDGFGTYQQPDPAYCATVQDLATRGRVS